MPDSTPLTNPFVGLRAFEENEDYLFFGRSAEINDLIKKFGTGKFLAVIGSSGSGKSSLVKSGLLPAIYGGFLAPGKNWRVASLRPGENPIGKLSDELSREGVLYKNVAKAEINYRSFVETTLRRSTSGLVQAYRQAHLPSTENLLIIVDQFEELFRYNKDSQKSGSESDAINFVKLLLEAADENQTECPIYILITMRSDFLGDCSRVAGLPEAINAGQYLVPRMTRDEIREAITGPVAVAGAQIAPRLVTRVLNDVGDNLDQLPILQHAMMRTWDAWQRKNKPASPIDIQDYEKIGTMRSALSLHADEAYDELSDKQKLLCEFMFKALTDKAADVRGIRRPRVIKDLAALTNGSTQDVIEVVEVFRKAGRTFLMPPPSIKLNENSVIDISHESLMRIWQKLVEWTEEEVVSSTIYKRLVEAADREAKGEGSLWVNPELQIALNWRSRFNVSNDALKVWAGSFSGNFDQAINFLDRSNAQAKALRAEKERIARRNRKIALATIVVLALIALGAFAAVIFISAAKREAVKAQKAAMHSDTLAQIALKEAYYAKRSDSISHRSALENLAIAQAALKRDSVSRKITERALKDAQNQRDTAKSERKKAVDLLGQTLEQNRKIAVAEYQRLIREGPTEEDLIAADTFNYKVIAYDYHLQVLKTKFNIQNAEEKNDELYEKLYYCLKDGPNKKFVIDVSNRTISDSLVIGKNEVVYVAGDKLHLLASSHEEKADTLFTFKHKLSAFAVETVDKRILISTEDNDLTILKFDAQYKTTVENTIPMGGLVTALDYSNNPDVIFFGLKTGEVGYIKYENKKESKYQPVYRNQLESRITGIDFFLRKGTYYLLATSAKGKAVVYETGSARNSISDFMNTETKLTEIALPESQSEIKKARYDSFKDRILLVTAKDTKLWNPFVNDLLTKLESSLNASELEQIKSQTQLYK